MNYGKCVAELEVGQHFRHWPGRTITEFDDTLFSLMTMNQHPLHIDENYARETQHGRRLVVGPLVISIVIGMMEADVGGQGLTILEYEDIQHLAPVFHGDTIYAEATILGKQQLAGQPERGVVTVEINGFNQHGEPILTLKRKIVLPMQSSAEQSLS
jgi:acyl dehydratase